MYKGHVVFSFIHTPGHVFEYVTPAAAAGLLWHTRAAFMVASAAANICQLDGLVGVIVVEAA